MKHFKKFFSYLVALTMVLSLAAFTGVKVHAEDTAGTGGATTYTLTLDGTTTGHTYEAYQVFTGDLSTDDGKKVLSNVKWGTGVTYTGTKSTAADVAKALGDGTMTIEQLQDDLTLTTPAKTVTSTEGSTVINGLVAGYYLVKDQNGTQKDKSDAYTKFIVQVVGDTTAAIKSDVPTVEKKVKDINDSEDSNIDDNAWQDSADYDIGDEIPYKLTGTLPTNYDNYNSYYYKFTDTMTHLTYKEGTLKVTANGSEVGSDKYSANFNKDTKTLTVEFKNLKDVIAKYSSTAKVIVEYSATLDQDANIGSTGNPNEVNLTYSNNPNKGGEGDTGETPKDKNIVFTYKTVVNKFDQDNKPLAGAAFKLEKKLTNDSYQTVKEFTTDGKPTKFEFTGLDDGDYRLTETTTPEGYNTIAPIEFTISATHEIDSSDPKLTELTVSKTSNGARFVADKDAGSLTTNVVNEKGSVLPSTGGMGTTLLYVAGGILVACAAAYVVMSRKHSTNK